MNKLTKINEGKILAGVCTGLEKQYGLNAWIFRLLFLFTGIGEIVYIILALTLPKEGE